MPDTDDYDFLPSPYDVELRLRRMSGKPEFCCYGRMQWHEPDYGDPFEVTTHMCGDHLKDVCELVLLDLLRQCVEPPLFS